MVAQQQVKSPVQVPVEVEVPATMTSAWFDAAVARSFEKDVQVKPLGQGRYAMTSSRDATLVYIVTAHSCQCEGFQRFHRCYHVCRAAFEDSFTGPEPSAPAAQPVKELAYGLDNGQWYVVTFAADGTVSGRVSPTRPAATIGPGCRCPGCGGDGQQRIREPNRTVTIEDCVICHGTGWIAAAGPRQPATVVGIPAQPATVVGIPAQPATVRPRPAIAA